jgi:hypothetical protein
MNHTLTLIIAALVIGGTAAGITVWKFRVDSGGHEAQTSKIPSTFHSTWGSREHYIAFLNRYYSDDPDLWRRIEAVKRRPVWDR